MSGQGTNTCGIRNNTSKENISSMKNQLKLSSPNLKDEQREKCFRSRYFAGKHAHTKPGPKLSLQNIFWINSGPAAQLPVWREAGEN